MVHVYAGNLLMTTGSYDDATKAFTNANCVQKCSLALYQRARCHIALSDIDEAYQDLLKVMEMTPHDRIAFIDKECLHTIKLGLTFKNPKEDKVPLEKAIAKLTKLIAHESSNINNIKQINSSNAVRSHA
jgi:tetratricopeptide (TPR) repeat protein